MNNHRTSLFGLYPMSHNRPHPSPEFQEGVAKWTRMTMPFGKMKLKNKPFFRHHLQVNLSVTLTTNYTGCFLLCR